MMMMMMMMMMMKKKKDEIDERSLANRRISTDETVSELNITHRGDARTKTKPKIFHSDRSRKFIESQNKIPSNVDLRS
jgi:hypothetical protein